MIIYNNHNCHLFEKSELIPELEHGLTDDTLLRVVFRLQASQCNLRCLLVRLVFAFVEN